jgi:NADH-quinone oxidoreductase subunit M
MYIIIGVWGSDERIYAAFKFFLYTLAGSLLFLLAMIFIYIKAGTFDLPYLYKLVPSFSENVQILLWLAFFASFAVKVPMWPFHTWLPDAHVQAPTAGSVILAGILLKLGGYGFIRFSLPLFPEASHYFQYLIFALSAIAVIYASCVALAQTNMKKLIAYSSVAHMGFVTIGIFCFNAQGINGAIFQMLSHGVVSAALFLFVGVLYEQMHTKEISHYGGVVEKMPAFAAISLFFYMASIGLPGTSGFVGETLVLVGTFKVNVYFSAICAVGVILGAAYMLWLYKRIFFGTISNNEVNILRDVSKVELLYFTILIAVTLFMGIYPMYFIQNINESVLTLIDSIARNGKL